MSEKLTIGFLPLVDACLPILAHEHGYAEEEGLELTFLRDVSWATVLDHLLYGHTDAAHMLAPLAIAATLGRGRPAQPLAAPAATVATPHVGGPPCLVDEDQAFGIEVELAIEPLFPALQDVKAVLLSGVRCLFCV